MRFRIFVILLENKEKKTELSLSLSYYIIHVLTEEEIKKRTVSMSFSMPCITEFAKNVEILQDILYGDLPVFTRPTTILSDQIDSDMWLLIKICQMKKKIKNKWLKLLW